MRRTREHAASGGGVCWELGGIVVYEFTSDGFLASDSDELVTAIRATCPDVFDRAYALNRELHESLFQFEIQNRDPQQLLVATLAPRALEHFQSAIVLLERGLVASGAAVTRALLESVFAVRALIRDESFVERYIASDLPHRKKLINKLKQNAYPVFEEANAAIRDEDVESLDIEIVEHDARSISAEELSRAAGMHDWYLSAYSMLSQPVHSSVREMDRYLTIDALGEVKALQYGPSSEEIPHLVLTACRAVLLGVGAAAEFFSKPVFTAQEHLDFIESRLAELPG